MKLTGRTILITGGSAGIGLAFALKFLELGNQVIVTGRRQSVLDELKARGHEVVEPLGQTSANSIAVTPNGLLGAPDPRTRGTFAAGQ